MTTTTTKNQISWDTHSRCRSIRLTKCIKNHRQFILRNSNPSIHHRKLNRHHLIIQTQQPTPQRYMPLPRHLTRRKFDSIPYQIRNDLSQPQGISDKLIRNITFNLVRQI